MVSHRLGLRFRLARSRRRAVAVVLLLAAAVGGRFHWVAVGEAVMSVMATGERLLAVRGAAAVRLCGRCCWLLRGGAEYLSSRHGWERWLRSGDGLRVVAVAWLLRLRLNLPCRFAV